MNVAVFFKAPSVCVVQNRETQVDRRSHYLNTGTVSPVICPQGPGYIQVGYMCVGGCVFECMSDEPRETNLHHPLAPPFTRLSLP